jgi:hypothetical protein
LRADRPWVESVSANPAALNDTGVPLLPSELAELGRAVQSTQPLITLLTWYGERHPDLYAGVVVEGRRAVLLMKGDPALHQATLRAIPGGSDAIDVRSVKWSKAELEKFAGEVRQQEAWFESVGADLVAADPSLLNIVRVLFLAARGDLAPEIASHFGNPEWLRPEWEGPLPWRGPRGTMITTVVDGSGKPLEGAQCAWIPVDPSIDADSALAFSTDSRGICRNDYLPATTYRVEVSINKAGGGTVVIGTGRGTVPPDGVGTSYVVADR